MSWKWAAGGGKVYKLYCSHKEYSCVCLLQTRSLLKFLFMGENSNNTYTWDFLPFLLETMPWLFFFLKQFSSLHYFHRRTDTGFSRNPPRVKKNLFPMTFYLQVFGRGRCWNFSRLCAAGKCGQFGAITQRTEVNAATKRAFAAVCRTGNISSCLDQLWQKKKKRTGPSSSTVASRSST